MAVLKYIESPRKDLGSIVIDSGLVINCDDSREIFFDMTDEIRMQTEKIVILQLTQERFSLQQSNTASNAKLYYVKENESFYIYGNDGWSVVITTNEIGHIIGNPKNIVPTTITRGDTTYAPLTLATQVFTDDGETVESKLDQIGQLSSSFNSILVTEKGKSFDIPVPYDEFFSYPNAMMVYIGTVQIYPNRYSVEGNRITFQEPVDANKTINFSFLFNSKIPTMGVMKYIDGAYIARGTIPIDRMAKYSNDIYTNDTTSVATSAAVRKLFDTLTPLIDGAGIIKRCVTTNTSVNLYSNLTNEYKLLDGNVLLCKFHTDVADNATLLVAGTAYPIYNLDGNPIKQGQINQNDELFIQYNDSNKRFYVTNGLPYGIQTRSAVEIATEGQTEFSYANVAYNRGTDYMAVFQNSVKLIEKEHFIFDGKNKRVNLVGYTAEEGDVFEFVVLSIVRSRSLGDGVMVGLNNAEEVLLEKFNDYATKTGTGASGTWGIDIAGNANTATNADTLDGYHENSFLRYRGEASATGEDTIWSQIGIKGYYGCLPKGITASYDYGGVVSLPADAVRLDIWYNHQSSSGEGLQYRTGWYKDQRAWARLLDSNNFISFAPTKTGTGASGTWGINITGTATKLSTARTIQTNLASTSSASFDGTANVAPGVTGILPEANGGTGQSNLGNVTVGRAGALSSWKYRPETANNTFADTRVRYYIATASMSTARPPNDGAILHLPWDNGMWDMQLFISNKDATVATRAQNASGDWSNSTGWKKLAFADDVPVKNGTGATGTWGINISGTATKATQDSLGNTITDTYAKKADIQVITGEVANGGTIPLPNGFGESECKWFAGIKHSNVNEWRIDIAEGHRSNLLAPICTLNGRIVTVGTQVAGLDGGSYTQEGGVDFGKGLAREFMPGTAWYICIGIHR